MSTRQVNKVKGLTLVELMVAVLISMIAVFAIGVVLVDSPRSFKGAYEQAYSDVVTQSYAARRFFDSTVRKSDSRAVNISEDGKQLEVVYYSRPDSTFCDEYALLYVSDGQLKVQTGRRDSDGVRKSAETKTICENVSDCRFKSTGRSVTMILTLDDGFSKDTVTTSAVMHN